MNNQQLERLIRVSQKTGSPVIILDESGEEVVLLPLSTYESLLDEGLYSFEEEELFNNQIVEQAPIIDLDDIDGVPCQLNQEQESKNEAPISGFASDEELGNVANTHLNSEKDDSSALVDEEQFYLEPIE